MRALLAIAILGAAATAAHADDTCTKGKESAKVERKLEGRVAANTNAKPYTFTIYDGGTWELARPDVKKPETGCLTKAEQKALADALADKPEWKKHGLQSACAAVGMTYDVFTVGGKAVWESHMCAAEALDVKSEKVLDAIRAVVQRTVK